MPGRTTKKTTACLLTCNYVLESFICPSCISVCRASVEFDSSVAMQSPVEVVATIVAMVDVVAMIVS